MGSLTKFCVLVEGSVCDMRRNGTTIYFICYCLFILLFLLLQQTIVLSLLLSDRKPNEDSYVSFLLC